MNEVPIASATEAKVIHLNNMCHKTHLEERAVVNASTIAYKCTSSHIHCTASKLFEIFRNNMGLIRCYKGHNRIQYEITRSFRLDCRHGLALWELLISLNLWKEAPLQGFQDSKGDYFLTITSNKNLS